MATGKYIKKMKSKIYNNRKNSQLDLVLNKTYNQSPI